MADLRVFSRNRKQSWGLIGISLYFFSLGLPLAEFYSKMLICVLAAIAVFMSNEINMGRGKPVLTMMIMFVFLTGLSTLGSVDYSRSLIINLSFFPAAVVFFVIVEQFDLRQVTFLFFVLTSMTLTLNSFLAVITWNNFPGDPTYWMSAVSFTYLSTPNDLILVALVAPLTIALIYMSPLWPIHFFSFISLVFSFSIIILLRSNAALVVMLVEVILLCFFLRQKYIFIGLLILLLLVIIGDGLQGFLLLDKFTNLSVWGNRVPLWLAAYDMFLDAPIIGHGPGSFSILSKDYIGDLSMLEWMVQDPRHAPWVHNLYLELLAERGILGLVSMIAIVGVVGRELLLMSLADNKVRIYATALLASLCGIILAGMFELSILRHWVLVLFVAICAITLVLARQEKC